MALSVSSKETDTNTIPRELTVDINNKINQKKRKIFGYLPVESLFLNEIALLNVTDNAIFYKIEFFIFNFCL